MTEVHEHNELGGSTVHLKEGENIWILEISTPFRFLCIEELR